MPDGSRRNGAGRQRRRGGRVSPLELAASGAGLLLTLAMLAFIGWEALTRPGDVPPAITIATGQVSRSGDVWVVQFDAINHAPATAANVEVVGSLRRDGREVETGRATLDFVPGGSSAHGGLFFRTDPRGGEIDMRALGYAEP